MNGLSLRYLKNKAVQRHLGELKIFTLSSFTHTPFSVLYEHLLMLLDEFDEAEFNSEAL